MSEYALILAGHGSHISPNTAGIVWSYVDRLRAWGAADEITACFWKEPPAFSQVIDHVCASEIVVVPVFTAAGYFTRQVLPAEMGLQGELSSRAGKTIRLTPAIGQHPVMNGVVDALLREAIDQHNLLPEDAAAVIIGHGTRRNPESRDATINQVRRLRKLDWVSEVVDVYLDDEPDIPSLFQRTAAANIIALPYFLAPGSHVSDDVPRALGMSGRRQPQRIQGRQVYYTDPVGKDQAICRAILQLAREAGLPGASHVSGGPWSGFPKAGRDLLTRELEQGRTLRFGPLHVTGRRVWQAGNSRESRDITSPRQLRAFLRDRPFRPLPTSADLPGGWQVDLEHPEQAHAVLETAFPGLVADWAAQKQGRLATESLSQIDSRQLGIFQGVGQLPRALVDEAVAAICGGCIRQPTWRGENSNEELPCRAACNLFLSKAVSMGRLIA